MYETLLRWDRAWDPSDERLIYLYPACQKDHQFHFFLKQVKTWCSTASIMTLTYSRVIQKKGKKIYKKIKNIQKKKERKTNKQAHHFEIVWSLWIQGAQPQQYFHTWLNLYRGNWTEFKESTGHLSWALRTGHLSTLKLLISISLRIFTSRRFGGTALTFSTLSVQQPTVSASSSSCSWDQQLFKSPRSKWLKK